MYHQWDRCRAGGTWYQPGNLEHGNAFIGSAHVCRSVSRLASILEVHWMVPLTGSLPLLGSIYPSHSPIGVNNPVIYISGMPPSRLFKHMNLSTGNEMLKIGQTISCFIHTCPFSNKLTDWRSTCFIPTITYSNDTDRPHSSKYQVGSCLVVVSKSQASKALL